MVQYMNDLEEVKEFRNIPIGELKFYKILEVLSDNWLVWFSLEWYYQDENKIDFSEADFMLFNKNYGFIVIEVKVGKISNDSKGKWYSSGYKVKDPFYQAKNSMFFFRDNFINAAKSAERSNELLFKENYFPLRYIFAVAFPDCQYKSSLSINQAAVHKDFIFDEDDLLKNKSWKKKRKNSKPPLEIWLVNQFEKYNKKPHNLSKEKICDFFKKTMSSEIKTKMRLNTWLEFKKKVFKRINKEQDRIISLLKYKIRAAFIGSAGTGKTFIAIKKIAKEIKNNKSISILYLCYNRALKGFVRDELKNQLEEYNIQRNPRKHRVTIRNIDNLIVRLIKDYQNKISSINLSDYVKSINSNDEKSKSRMFENLLKNRKFKHKYDVVLIDEAQDFPKKYLSLMTYFLKNPSESKMWIFYDNSQTLYKEKIEEIPLDFMGLETKRDKLFLSTNLRNTEKIVGWYNKETHYGNYTEVLSKSKQKIRMVETQSFSLAIDKTIKIIAYLSENLIDPNRIIVLGDLKLKYLYNDDILRNRLSIKKEKIRGKRITREFKSYEIEKEGIILSEPNKGFYDQFCSPKNYYKKYNRIYYSGIGSFKGLESDIIILLLDKEKFQKKKKGVKRRIYVGASRAKFLLYVIKYQKNK